MSIIRSDSDHLTLNAQGSSKSIKFQSAGVEKASISSVGLFTSTTIDATKLTGILPAIDGSNLTGLVHTDSTKLSLAGGALTGAVTTNSTFDGVDIATRDGILTSTTTTANAALPKAGGTMTGTTAHGDSVKATYGASADLQIYHDGSHSYIKDTGTGNLYIKAAAQFNVQGSNNEPMIVASENGGVSLYYDNASKLATTSTGIDVTGDIDLADNGKIKFGASDDLKIYHDGSNSYVYENGTGDLRLRSNGASVSIQSDGGENLIVGTKDGEAKLYHNNLEKLATTSTGINVTGNVVVSGTVDGVDIASRDSTLTSTTSTANAALPKAGGTMTGTLNALSIYLTSANKIGADSGDYVQWTANSHTSFVVNSTERMKLDSSGIDITGRAKGTLTTDNDGSFSMSASNNFKCTPSGNFTLTFTNIVSQSGFILLVNSGGHTISAHGNSKVDANLLATITAAGTYLVSYFSDGTNVYLTNSAIYT